MSNPPSYLTAKIAEVREGEPPRYGMTRDGYTVRSGAPTSREIRLEGEKRWRRVMVWCFSNSGTLFVRIKGEPHILHEHDIPEGRARGEARRPRGHLLKPLAINRKLIRF